MGLACLLARDKKIKLTERVTAVDIWRNLHAIVAAFREVRDLIAIACFKDIINEDDFMFLWDLNSLKNVDFLYEDHCRFDEMSN